MSTRYKAKPITTVDAVRWTGMNIEEVRALCPEVEIPLNGSILVIPIEEEFAEVYVDDVIMKNVGSGKYSKLDADVFYGLYEKL
jgi:hypothetical protein